MKVKIKNIALLAFTALSFGVGGGLLTSCSDFLDKEPSNELSKEKTFAGFVNAQQFHYDTYNFLLHGALRINNSWLDAATDLAESAIGTSGVRSSFNVGNYYGSAGAPELTSPWESRYRGIRKCNMVLAEVDSIAKPADYSEEQFAKEKAQLVSEARFFRAYFYWELFLRYGPVPMVTKVLDPDGDLLSEYKERPSFKTYTQFILKELDECVPGLLTYDEASSTQYAGRIIQPIPVAFKSRVLLYLASPRFAAQSGVTMKEAADAAKKFIDVYGDGELGANNYALYDDPTKTHAENYYNAVLQTPYTGNNRELIFYRNDATIGWGQIFNDTPIGEGGNGGNCPSQNLVDMYDMEDGSAPFASYDATGAPVYNGVNPTPTAVYSDKYMWQGRDPRLAATVLMNGAYWNGRQINVVLGQADNTVGNAYATPTGYYMKKYIPETILGSNHGGTAYRNWVIMRYAEILLNYAEALCELPDFEANKSEICIILDKVRHRAGILGNVEYRDDLNSQAAMRNFIRKERTVEFAFEEHRWWDVRRWNVAKEALSRPIYGVDVDANGNITRKVAQKRVFEDKMYLYPIPEEEAWKTNIENNPGW